jgi:carbon storage regulator
MLVLTRQVGEEIVIDNSIRVTVVSVHHGKVRLGVEAPRSVSVDRAEVRARKGDGGAADVPHLTRA